VDGILNINKPPGKTSFAVVALVRRLIGERRVGHAGTLDPAATGVLPVCFGQGTRVSHFLMDATKCYQAQFQLGITTDTHDADGKIVAREDPSCISQEQFTSALAAFTGEIQQTPPMHSAVKYHGRRLYELAHRGITVARSSRLTRIYSLQLIEWQPPLATIEVTCGKGTYVRSLAHDLGEALGCGAIVRNLVRLRCGPFDINDAVSLAELEDAVRNDCWQPLVYPVDTVLLHWAAIVVGDAAGYAIKNGRPVTFADEVGLKQTAAEGRCRAYTDGGCFLGVLRFNGEVAQWQPEKVFCSERS
jgi:tRNA pseudouridine55 synthase